MSRGTVYNNIVTDENWALVNEKNKNLMEEFVNYLDSADRSDKTVSQYNSQLRIFFVWNLEHNDNKFFIDLKKKDLIKYMGYLRNVLGSSPNRICSQKSVLCSLSNYIERFDDEEYPEFRNIAKVIESPVKTNIRKKTILEQDEVDECLSHLVEDKNISWRVSSLCLLLVVQENQNFVDLRLIISRMNILFMVAFMKHQRKLKQKAEENLGNN